MGENPYIEMMKRHSPTAHMNHDAIAFIENGLSDQYSGEDIRSLAFVRDPSQPHFYGRVRGEILKRVRGDGIYEMQIDGVERTFRVEDGGTRYVTFHPVPERSGFLVSVVERKVVQDGMIFSPWRC